MIYCLCCWLCWQKPDAPPASQPPPVAAKPQTAPKPQVAAKPHKSRQADAVEPAAAAAIPQVVGEIAVHLYTIFFHCNVLCLFWFNPFRPEFASKLKCISTMTKMSRNQVYI